MFCTSCGVENVADSRFCKQCGHRMDSGVVPDSEVSSTVHHAAALLERAYRARKEGNALEAVGLCREALQENPESLSALALLGQLYEAMGDRELAIHTYERLVQLSPSSMAERGKLDDLRGEGLFPVPRGAASHVLYTGARAGVSPWHALGFAVAGAALVTLGGFIAVSWRESTRSSQAPPRSLPAVSRSGGSNAKAGREPEAADSQSGVVSIPPSFGVQQSPVFVPSTIPYPAEVPRPSRQVRVAEIHPAAASSAFRTAKKRELSNHRLQLSGDEAGTEGQGSITIKVDSDTTRGAAGKRPPAGSGSAKVVVDNESHASEITIPTSQDAQSYLAMADTLKLTGKFDKAIVAYRHALPSGGDQAGYIYQQIGDCFRKRGDKDSAVNNYHNAVGEYQKLIDSSRNVEYASDGKRVCEKAIKTCTP